MESPCECGIEPPGTISHGVNIIIVVALILAEDKSWQGKWYDELGTHCIARFLFERNAPDSHGS